MSSKEPSPTGYAGACNIRRPEPGWFARTMEHNCVGVPALPPRKLRNESSKKSWTPAQEPLEMTLLETGMVRVGVRTKFPPKYGTRTVTGAFRHPGRNEVFVKLLCECGDHGVMAATGWSRAVNANNLTCVACSKKHRTIY